jgi:hypothetical protein
MARRVKALERLRNRVKELMASPDPDKMARAMDQLERLQAKITAETT